MLYHQLPTSSHYLHAITPLVKKFPIFTEPYGLLSSLQKPIFGSYILDQLNPFHNVLPYPLQNASHMILFFDVFHAYVERIYHRGLAYYMPSLSRPQFNRPDNVSLFVFILYSPDIVPLLDPNIQLVTLTLTPDIKQY